MSISAKNVRLDADDTAEGRWPANIVALSVADTGCGIPADLLSRVVEPFFTTKGPDKGTGLGLSQVYGFARRSNGTVSIDSEMGGGTTVTVYLPRSHAAVAMPSPEDNAQYVAMDRQTILVVEDNPDVRIVAVSLLRATRLPHPRSGNGIRRARIAGQGEGHRRVFSDVVLPGQIDGLALARTVSDHYPRIPVVLTTGYTKVFETDPEFPVLRKPYQISALGRVIHQALNPKMPPGSVMAN